MADLTDIEAAESVKIIGANSSGVEQVPVQTSTNGGLHTNLRNDAGTEIATSSNPLRIDPTGTTSQPISAVSLPLPTGAATSDNQSTIIASLASIDAGVPTTLGQTTMSASMPVTMASDQTYPFATTDSTSAPSLVLNLGAYDGTTVRRIQGRISTPGLSSYGVVVRPVPYQPKTVYVSAQAVTIGNNKSMFSALNDVGSGVRLKLQQLFIYNVQTTAVTGVIAQFQLRFITGHSAGTQLTTTPAAAGMFRMSLTSDTLNGLVTFRTNSTVAGEDAFSLKRWLWSSDEFGTGTADAETTEHTDAQLVAAYTVAENASPITLLPGEGLTIKQTTNSTAGSFDIFVVFTEEVV